MAIVSSLATTMGTGIVASGALAVTFSVPQAQAETYKVTLGGDSFMHSCTFTSEADGTSTLAWDNAAANNSTHTLHFVAPAAAGDDVTLQIQYNTFSTGAIIVDADSNVAGIGPNDRRDFIIGGTGTFASTFNRDFTLAPNNGLTIKGNTTLTVAEGKTLSLAPSGGNFVQQDGTLTLAGAGTVYLSKAITLNGGLNITSGVINLNSAMAEPIVGTENGFLGGSKYVFATGSNVATVAAGTIWKVDGVAVNGTYADNTLLVTSTSSVYGIVQANSETDSSNVSNESGYLISGANAILKLTDITTDFDTSLPDGIIVDTGDGNAATIVLDSEGVTMAASDITRTSGILNITVEDGSTLELTQNTGSPNINGDLTIHAGGTVNGTVGDVFGWRPNATKTVHLIGAEGNEATLNLAARATMSTDIVLAGHTQIVSTSAADAADPAALDTFGGTITATGTNNTIGVAIREREALTIDVTGTADTLDITGRIYRSASGGDGSITKTGEGILTFSYSNAENTNEFYGSITVSGGTLKFAGDATLNKAIKVAADGTFINEANISINSLENLDLFSDDSYTDFSGNTAENGYLSGLFKVIGAEAGATIIGVDSILINGTAKSTIVDDATGSILISDVDTSTYWVNTQMVYDSATMAEISSFTVKNGATLTTTDTTMLNKVTLEAGGNLYLTNAAGDTALQFTGSQSGDGLNMTVADTIGEDGYLAVINNSTGNASYAGNIVVLSGTKLQSSGENDSLGRNYLGNTSRTITVQGGAMLDINGKEAYYHVVLEEGAVLANSGGEVGTGKRCLPIVDLTGNATIHANGRFGILGSGYAATNLNLNGHVLTKTGNEVFHLRNTAVNAGTLSIQQGKVEWLAGTIMQNSTIQLGNGGQLDFTDGTARNLGSLIVSTTQGEGTGGRIDVYHNAGALTVTGTTLADELLTKTGGGVLNLNGATTINAGLTVENGTVNLNGATTISSAITVANGGTLAVTSGGSVSISSLLNFEGYEATVPTTNGLAATDGTFKVLEKAEGATITNLDSINYGGTAYTIDADGNISLNGKIYYAVEEGSIVTVGGESATAGTEQAAEFYVKSGATLTFATAQSNVFSAAINGDGTVQVSFTDGNHNKSVSLTSFTGILEITGGNSDITTYHLEPSVQLKTTAGEHWSNGGATNLDILLSDTQGAFVFRPSGTFTMNGKVSGAYLDLGTTNTNSGTIVLTNSANDIQHVTMGTGSNTAKLTLAADMGFTSINAPKADSTLTLSDGITLTLGSGSATDASTVTTLSLEGDATINTASQATLTVTTQQGAGVLTKSGAGTMIITGSSAASSLAITAGELHISGATMEATSVSGEGTLVLGADSTFTHGATISSALNLGGYSLTGDITANGTLTSGGGAIIGNLTLGDSATATDTISANSITVGTYTGTAGMAATGDIIVGTSLTSAGDITASSITGEGDVSINGGTITLSDSLVTTGEISISNATLAGTWDTADATLGAGITVTGEITLNGATINGLITNTGTIALSGDINVGVAGVNNNATYTHGSLSSETGNGFLFGSTSYALISGGTSSATDVNWTIGGMEAVGTTSYEDGTLVVRTDSDPTIYWVNSGTVEYNGSSATCNSESVNLTNDTKYLTINGGTLKITGTVSDSVAITSTATGGTIDIAVAQSLSQSSLGTLQGSTTLTGSGTYEISTGSALADKLSVGSGWTGSIVLGDVQGDTIDLSALTNGANSSLYADTIACTGLTVGGNLEIGTSLTLGAVATDIISIGGKLTGQFDVAIDDTLFSNVITSGMEGSIQLGTIGGDTTGLGLTLNGKSSYSLGESTYTLSVTDGKLILKGAVGGSVWNENADPASTDWISTEQAQESFGDSSLADDAWLGAVPENGETANLIGSGEQTATVLGEVTPGHVRVDVDGSFTLMDGQNPAVDAESAISATGRLNITKGKLVLGVSSITFAGDNAPKDAEDNRLVASSIEANGELVVGLGAGATNHTEATIIGGLLNNGSATITDMGTLYVTSGTLNNTYTLSIVGTTTNEDTTARLFAEKLNNSGKVSVDSAIAIIGNSISTFALVEELAVLNNSGTYEITGGGSTSVYGDVTNTGTITVNDGVLDVFGNVDSTGGSLDLQKGAINISGSLTGINLDTVGKDVDLSIGSYTDTDTITVDGSLTFTGDSAISEICIGKGTLTVDGNSLTTGELAYGELTTESTAPVALVNGGSLTGEGGAPVLITVGNTAESLNTALENTDSLSFRLINGETDEFGYSLDDTFEQGLLRSANKAELLADGTTLCLNLRSQTDEELTWNTSEVDSVGGLHIVGTDNAPYYGYETLSTIKHVKVDADRTIDLTGVAPDETYTSYTINDLSGDKKLTVVGNGDDLVTINGGTMAGELAIENVAINATGLTLGTLTGVGTDYTVGGDITITNSASLAGSYSDAIITVTNDATANLKAGEGLTVEGSEGTINLQYDAPSTMTAINTTGADVNLIGAPENSLTLSEPSSMQGGKLNFKVNSEALGAEILAGKLTLNGTAINITQADSAIVIAGITPYVNTIADLDATNGTAKVTLIGAGLNKYFENARLENSQIVADRNADYVEEAVRPTTENGAAGAALLSDSLFYVNPQAQPETAPMQAALLDAVDNGNMTDKDLAAVAGASVTSMGMALSGDVERQLRAIRNRTTTMGVNECVVNEGMPYFNAWVNAEGNNTKLDKDSTFAGYDLNSWGGTVGMDVDFDPHFTAGLAITAMYGDLTANAADSAEGDMDTYYVSAFARYAASAWTHTFVATMGIMDATLNRTVYAGGNSYKTEGNTGGMSFGLMYEAGYVVPMNEDATACLQPIFNVMLRHSSVDSYTEKGSDAALEVGSQSMTTLTFGLGARMQAVVGESLYNRASIFEARALAKLDVGDHSSEADVAFLGGHGSAGVESAELGAFGVELGAGLTIPVGDDDGSIFVDGSVELRSGYTNVNGTVGYRINF